MRRQACGKPLEFRSEVRRPRCFWSSELQIELKGNLAAMLGAAQNAKRSPETGDLSLQVVMVAGACNQRYLHLWSGAA